MPTNSYIADNDISPEDRRKLSGLLGFAQGVLTARSKVQMAMQSGLGVFHEGDLDGLPGLHFDCEDGAWLRIDRQRETRPPEPDEHVAQFLTSKPVDPDRRPQIKPAIAVEVTIEEASDLAEGGLLNPDDVHTIVEDGIEVENRVRVVLHAEKLVEMRRDYEHYAGGSWSDWARQERPVRRAISVYNDLFKIHSAIHTSEGTPPELVWGIGIGRWVRGTERLDMPLIEQLVDIEVEDGGAIAIRPRDLAPRLSLKPYLELDIDGSPKLQSELQDRLVQLLKGDAEFSPFTTLWEPLLDTAANNLSSSATHISRDDLAAGESLAPAGEDLRITSSWAVFGRPRSTEARVQDLNALRARVDDEATEVPASIKGYAAPPPDKPWSDVSAFGLDSAVLGGATAKGWEPSASGEPRRSRSPDGAASPGTEAAPHAPFPAGQKVHFFPLPFNEEQGKISDMIDDPELHVVGVSGPPGTGKSHSIANIISHQMAMGKRVLVTARTPEAIAAVREKLPEALQPLVIASVGTDRESAQQLQEAVSELSREVVDLDTDQALARKAHLERQIAECDRTAAKADDDLAEIARANLAQQTWNGAAHTPMELVDILGEGAEVHDWFTDRPAKTPPAQLEDLLDRLRTAMPALAADIVYAGAGLPEPDDLPTTAEIIAAHETKRAWNAREIVDYSTAPTMAFDSTGAEAQARAVLAELESLGVLIEAAPSAARDLAIRSLESAGPIDRKAIAATLGFVAQKRALEDISRVRFDRGACGQEDFQQAAARGASGQKPVGFGLFNGALKSATGSVRLDGAAPASSEEWQVVLEACRLERDAATIGDALRPFVSENLMPPVPARPWEIARYLKDRQAEIETALEIADRLKPALDALAALFPYGLDLDAMRVDLDCGPAIFAIRGNLPDDNVAPTALTRLREIAGTSTLPVLAELRNLADALGQEETEPRDIVSVRGEITRELGRLAEVAKRLDALGRDLNFLAEAGAPDWVARLRETPESAPYLIPATWAASWNWAEMKARVDRIVALGNGDDHRRTKSEAMARRRKLFEELIRTRTLLGLKGRMTGSIRSAMEAFTQAISKIGTGKGKRAPRFIRAAQEAAKMASSAAPVWIMPEYKIPEQLPPEFGDFDLVILDEASQSDITALAALARGKKILVVGDEEQVSPSVVGIADQKINALRAEFLDGLPNASLIDQNSSIFEITKRMHPDSHVMLREHFRCVAPIIQFSGRYYNNALVPLRVPKASERFDPPLADVYIPGATRHGKTNASEARWIVDEIARLIEDPVHAGRDIGVISLIGGEQADKIGRMLVEDERIGPEKIEERRIIYGDARTMQGQERSIVFLSMVATPGHAHAQTAKADQQRINVAMSRARDRLYLVRSVSLEDLRPTDIKAQILHHFADPMPEGRGATGKEASDLLERCDSGFEREVLQRLMEANYRVRPQVAAGGFRIDLVVEGLEDRRLAIELDGDQYHGPDVWERDMARQAALERAGWVFWRVFGSQWKSNKEFWWRNLEDALSRLGIEPIGAAALDERFTETILVDHWGTSTAADAETRAEDIEVEVPQTQQDSAHGQTVSPAAEPAVAPTSEALRPEAWEDEVAAKAEKADANAAPVFGETSPAVQAEEPTTPATRAPERQGARQRTLPLEDDLFTLIAEREAAAPEPINGTTNGTVTATALEPKPSMWEAEDGAHGATPIRVGHTLRLEKLGNGGGKLEITLVETGHDPEHGMIGTHTPLGQALLDAEVGDEVEYRAGAYIQEVRILEVS
ncbi:AAA domain-containing protein [Leisingera daeponensis]|uniref:AAA domain-containing protein n=1 Tax=Leisingera daeponensis TaxID=405746 RepID=UPI00041D6B48|nr:AAA domain-containing protein [Leisingera daeponensis]